MRSWGWRKTREAEVEAKRSEGRAPGQAHPCRNARRRFIDQIGSTAVDAERAAHIGEYPALYPQFLRQTCREDHFGGDKPVIVGPQRFTGTPVARTDAAVFEAAEFIAPHEIAFADANILAEPTDMSRFAEQRQDPAGTDREPIAGFGAKLVESLRPAEAGDGPAAADHETVRRLETIVARIPRYTGADFGFVRTAASEVTRTSRFDACYPAVRQFIEKALRHVFRQRVAEANATARGRDLGDGRLREIPLDPAIDPKQVGAEGNIAAEEMPVGETGVDLRRPGGQLPGQPHTVTPAQKVGFLHPDCGQRAVLRGKAAADAELAGSTFHYGNDQPHLV